MRGHRPGNGSLRGLVREYVLLRMESRRPGGYNGAMAGGGEQGFPAPVLLRAVFMPSRCLCEALDNGGELCTSHADSGGLSQRVHRPLTDRLDSWIAGMIRPSCTKSCWFSRNSWSIPRANLALYYRRLLRRWSAPAAGCSRSLSVLTGGFKGVDGFIRHVGGLETMRTLLCWC